MAKRSYGTMSGKKKYVPTSSKRRRVIRKTKKSKRRGNLPRNFISNKKLCRLVYAETITLNASVGGGATEYNFSANGLYDPNISGTGHQPMGFDQLMEFYDHYTVIGSKIKVIFNPVTSTSVSIPPYVGVRLCDTTSRINGKAIDELREVGVSMTQMGSYQWKYPPTVYQRFSAKKFFSKKAIIGASQFQGSASANPTEDAIYSVFVVAPDTSTDPPTISVQVVIEYIAIFTEPKQLPQS